MASRGLGTLTLDLIAKIGGFEAGMDKAARHADKRMREIERRANAFGKALGLGIAAAGTIIVAGLTAATKAAIDQADAIRDLSIRTGVGTETLSAYGYAASQTGTDIETVGKGIKVLSKNMADSLNPTNANAKVFKELGISVLDSNKQLKNAADIIPELANKISSMRDGTTKAALMLQLFGKAGLDLTEFFNQGGAGLDAFAQKAAALGIIIDTKTATAADNFKDTLGDVHTAIGGLGLGIARELLPALQSGASDLVELIKQGNLASEIASVLGAAFSASAGALSLYDKAVRSATIGMEYYVRIGAAMQEIQRNIQSFGLANGSVAAGAAELRKAGEDYDAAREAILHPKKAPVKINIITGDSGSIPDSAFRNPATDSAAAKRAADLERRLALALSNPSAPKGAKAKKTGKSDAEREAERLQESYDRLSASLKEQIALTGQTSDVAKLRYDLENGELAKLNPQQKELLLTLAQTAEQREKDYEALQKQIDLEATQTENAKQVLADIAAERDLLGATIEQQDTYNKLKYAGVDANSAWGKSIIEANHALHEQAKQMAASIEIQDEWRDGLANAITDAVTGAKSLKEAFTDFFDSFAAMVTEMIAKQWVKQLFGEPGSDGGGSMGGLLSAFASLIGGGGFGGAGSPLANGGPINPNLFHEVGEYDRPEMLMRGGKQYLIPGNKGRVVPFSGGGGVSQNLNFYYAAPPDPRTQQQTAARVAFETRRASGRNS